MCAGPEPGGRDSVTDGRIENISGIMAQTPQAGARHERHGLGTPA